MHTNYIMVKKKNPPTYCSNGYHGREVYMTTKCPNKITTKYYKHPNLYTINSISEQYQDLP